MEQSLKALQNLLPPQVNLVRNGVLARFSAEVLVPGDIILLEAGDIVPADCRLIQGVGVTVNNATITGESTPQLRNPASSSQGDLLHSRNVLLASASIVSGRARALVFATGARTEFGRIAHVTQTSDAPISSLRKQLAYLSRLIVLLAVGMGLSFFAIGAVLDVPFWHDFIFSIGIIVAMVPEGLQPTLTLALVLAANRMAKRNVLIQHLGS